MGEPTVGKLWIEHFREEKCRKAEIRCAEGHGSSISIQS